MLGSRRPKVCYFTTLHSRELLGSNLRFREDVSAAAAPYAFEFNYIRREMLERPACLFEVQVLSWSWAKRFKIVKTANLLPAAPKRHSTCHEA